MGLPRQGSHPVEKRIAIAFRYALRIRTNSALDRAKLLKTGFCSLHGL
jgi:hypothetical protein